MGRHRLAARRRELGLTQEQLAYALGHDPGTISRWERGESTPQPLHRRPLADALDVSLAGLSALLADRRPDPATPAREVEGADPAGDGAAALRATTRQIVGLDTRHGGDDLVRLAVRSFRGGHGRLARREHRPGAEHELGAAVAEAGQVAAWVAYDADDQPLSRRLHHEALVVARLAGDRTLEVFLLASMAMQALYVGDAAEALRIADDVLDGRRLTGRTAALFHVRRARALARAGERQRSLDTMRRARVLLTEGPTDQDPPWTWWITDAELAWHEGMILGDLGDRTAAVDSFHAAVDARSPSLRRSRHNDLAHLWCTLLAAGAWGDAEPVVADLLAGTDDLRSGRTRALLRRGVRLVDRATAVPSTLGDASDALRHFVTA